MLNYDKYYINYTYYQNFYYFKSEIDSISEKYNDYFDSLRDEISLQEKLEIFSKLITPKKYEIKQKTKELKNLYRIDKERKIKQINYKYFLIISNNIISIYSYNNKKNEIILHIKNSTILKRKEYVYDISVSNETNQIFLCLLFQKKIKILDFDLSKKILKLNQNQIIDDEQNEFDHFSKCVLISTTKNYLATIDKQCQLNIWGMPNNETKLYIKIRENLLKSYISDLLKINDESIVLLKNKMKTIIFLDTNNFEIQKEIKNIDSIDSIDALFLFKSFIIINCYKGLAIVSIKKKELVTYIENYRKIDLDVAINKKLCLNGNEGMYILYPHNNNFEDNMLFISIIKLEMNEGILEESEMYDDLCIEDINNTDSSKDVDSSEYSSDEYLKKMPSMFCLNKKDIFIYGDKVDILQNQIDKSNKLDDDFFY